MAVNAALSREAPAGRLAGRWAPWLVIGFLITVIVVTLLLILTYRSPVLWIIPPVAVGAAALTAMATVYLLVKSFGIVVNDQNSALLTILVFGVGTDYALLLIARYRETLHHHENVRVAMVHALRGAAPAILASSATGAEAIVGGPSAENLDTEVTTSRDEKLVIPLVLAVVLIVLGLLLRAIVAPLVLMATVIVSFAAAFGGSMFVFDTILGFKGVDYSVPLLAFLFLVALGLVLAATFAVLTALPLVMLIEVGFLVAFGVLLDALLVRSVLVPALTLLIGRQLHRPSRLSRPVELPDGRRPLADDEEPTLQR
jgi:uncharacterized membrane protein YdfJ with MMPL/SSD domain